MADRVLGQFQRGWVHTGAVEVCFSNWDVGKPLPVLHGSYLGRLISTTEVRPLKINSAQLHLAVAARSGANCAPRILQLCAPHYCTF